VTNATYHFAPRALHEAIEAAMEDQLGRQLEGLLRD
jgi:hypothetical protein